MFRQCTNPRCVTKTGFFENRCEKCLSLPKEDSANNACRTKQEPHLQANALAVKQETRQISSPPYSDFRLSDKFDDEISAARWLQRLRYDFLCAGIPDPSPNHIFTAIDMLAQGKVAIFIDSKYRALCDKSNHSFADLEILESALKKSFPRVCLDREDGLNIV